MSLSKSVISSKSSSQRTSPVKASSPVIKSLVKRPLKSSAATVSSCTSAASSSTDDHLVRPTGDMMSMSGTETPPTSVSKQKSLETKRTETLTKSEGSKQTEASTKSEGPKTPAVKTD